MGLISDYLNQARGQTPYQKSLGDARAAAGPMVTPAPVQPSSVPLPTISPGSALDPLGNVRSDVASEYRRGAQASTATGVGLAAREAVVSPVSRVIGGITDAGKAVGNTIATAAQPLYEAGRAAATGALPPPPTISDALLKPLPAVNSAGAAPALNESPTIQGGASAAQAPQSPLSPRRVVITGFQEQQPIYASYQPLDVPQQDPTQQIMALQNNGTWSGMINAKTLARRTDADRAAAVAAATAASHTISALASERSAQASERTARTGEMKAGFDAAETSAKTGVLQQQALSAQYAQQQKQQMDALSREMVDPKTTPERRKEIERTLVAVHGRNPSNPQIHATPIFDATGQKVGERLHERQADGTWKDVTPKTPLKDNPQAMAIVSDTKMSDEEKRAKLKGMGYQ